MDNIGLTLEDAVVFAEFKHDDRAIETLTQALRWNQHLGHVAKRLHDAAVETAARAAEAARLRAEGLPVLDPVDTVYPLPLDNLVTADGQPIPEPTGLASPAQPSPSNRNSVLRRQRQRQRHRPRKTSRTEE